MTENSHATPGELLACTTLLIVARCRPGTDQEWTQLADDVANDTRFDMAALEDAGELVHRISGFSGLTRALAHAVIGQACNLRRWRNPTEAQTADNFWQLINGAEGDGGEQPEGE